MLTNYVHMRVRVCSNLQEMVLSNYEFGSGWLSILLDPSLTSDSVELAALRDKILANLDVFGKDCNDSPIYEDGIYVLNNNNNLGYVFRYIRRVSGLL